MHLVCEFVKYIVIARQIYRIVREITEFFLKNTLIMGKRVTNFKTWTQFGSWERWSLHCWWSTNRIGKTWNSFLGFRSSRNVTWHCYHREVYWLELYKVICKVVISLFHISRRLNDLFELFNSVGLLNELTFFKLSYIHVDIYYFIAIFHWWHLYDTAKCCNHRGSNWNVHLQTKFWCPPPQVV